MVHFQQHSAISGQQIGLLGGPLFVLYKILGVYRLVEKPELGLPTDLKPVFWLEGNDADLYEISTFHGIDQDRNIRSYHWSPKQPRGQPIGNYLVDEDLHQLYQEYFSAFPVTSHTEEIKDLVFTSYQLGKSLLTSQYSFFSKLFKEFEKKRPEIETMTWFRSDDTKFRNFSSTILQEELRSSPEGQCPVFVLLEGRREAIFKRDGYYFTRRGKKIDPEGSLLLPSVWNRSILQDSFWKAAVYVAGPSEEKYLNDLKPGYAYYRVNPAQVISRMSTTLIDNDHLKSLRYLGFDLEEIIDHDEGFLISSLQSKDPDLQIGLGELKKLLREEKEEAVRQFRFEHPSYQGVKKYEKKMYIEMKHRLGKKRKEFKNRKNLELVQLKKIMNWLHPSRKRGFPHFPQERFHNVVTFLIFYGLDTIEKIYQDYRFEQGIIYLDKQDKK